jgi:hypothetical protein
MNSTRKLLANEIEQTKMGPNSHYDEEAKESNETGVN